MAERGLIRPMVHADLELVRAWRNHPRVREHLFTRNEIGPDEHRAWFARKQVDPASWLFVVEAERPIGFVQFSAVAGASRVLEWGFYARPDRQGGEGRALGRLALAHAFGPLGAHKVCGQVLAANAASLRFHERLGFAREGVLRDQHPMGPSFCDVVCFGLLADEWLRATRRDNNAPD